MAVTQRSLSHSTNSTTVADLLERVLDKGIVIAGDVRIKLVEVELLTLEIRLLICSVDKAVEMGLDWWRGNPAFDTGARGPRTEMTEQKAAGGALPAARPVPHSGALPDNASLEQRLARIESMIENVAGEPSRRLP
ncbi:MAG: gas vesicle protein [Thiohalocapsa sp.]|nr:gas vesicle protein [Thiohalocapsa sp.]MCF7990506.1 gas vesicle protein [Thiohalocapsa sp.]